MLNYVNSDSEFTLNTDYGCSPLEVELTFVREYHDSLDALIINVIPSYTPVNTNITTGFSYVDSVFRDKLDPRTGQQVNYILSYYVDWTGVPTKIDSIVWTPEERGNTGCGSEVKIKKKRKLTFREAGRYSIITTSRTKGGCDNNSTVHHVAIGHMKSIAQNKTIICQNEKVEFRDSALYQLIEPDASGNQFTSYNYWRDGNRFKHPNGDPRVPTPFHESIRWDFGQGNGFVPLRFNPLVVSYNLPGHYVVKAEFMDSVGCKDTVQLELDVTGGKSYFNYTVNITLCKPLLSFYDSSHVIDPCRNAYGYGCDSVIRWIWDFGDGSPIINTTVDNPVSLPIKHPSHLYPRFGEFEVKLIIETRMGCFDTSVRTIFIEGPRPQFDFSIDSIGCAPYTVFLGNSSVNPSNRASWTWDFGDGSSISTTSDTVVYHTYSQPGKYKLLLIQRELVPLTSETCMDSFPSAPRSIEVTVLPQKKVDFTASKLEACPNESISFTDNSDSTYFTFKWDFGDGTVITLNKNQGGRQVSHSYAVPGNYVVRLSPDYAPISGEPKCKQSKAFLIKVHGVKANFMSDTAASPLFKFINTSTNYTDSWWRFGDGTPFTKCPQVDPVNCPNAHHNYANNLGIFDVCLAVSSPEGCFDTTCAIVQNAFEVGGGIRNVFTPNGYGVNDEFVVELKNWTKYEIKIYTRFSDLVFQSNDPGISWKGRMNNSGDNVAEGTYYVVITYQLRGEPEKTYNGTITLLR